MIDSIGHFHSYFADSFFQEDKSSIIDKDVDVCEVILSYGKTTFTFFTNSSIEFLLERSNGKYFKVPPLPFMISSAACLFRS